MRDKEREKVMIDSYVHRWTIIIYIYTYTYTHTHTYSTCNKAILLQAFTGPEGSRRLRLPYFKTIDTWIW